MLIGDTLIEFTITSFSKKSEICCAICIATFSWASIVDAPKWGVKIKFLDLSKLVFLGGSSLNTSRAAPAIWERS